MKAFKFLLPFAILFSCATSPTVYNNVEYSNKGSKSEARSWQLVVNGKTIPDYFSAVLVNDKLYVFKTRAWQWGDDGYVYMEERESVDKYFPKTVYTVSKNDLALGMAEVSGRFDNMPRDWFLVKWDGGIAALSAEKIEALVKEKSLQTIPRKKVSTFIKQ